jgi:outer membrane lipoprotein-sorting protein
MKKITLGILVVVLMSFVPSGKTTTPIRARELTDKMLYAIEQMKTVTYKMKKTERVGGEYKKGEQDAKLQLKPRCSYVYVHEPTKGVEVLFVEGKNNNNALVKPNAFPYINLNLDPYGSIMRKGNHHTLYELGFNYIGAIIKDIADKSGDKLEEYFVIEGEVVFDHKKCYKLIIHYKPYALKNYTIAQGETLTNIAYRDHLSDFKMLELNPSISDYNAVKPGQVIKVPSAYAQKTVLYIDKHTFLPIMQSIYDEKGLFEQYEFYNVKLNPPIKPEEFTKGYKDYRF